MIIFNGLVSHNLAYKPLITI